MKDPRQELAEEINTLTPQELAKVCIFANLLINCPGFKADLKAAAPAGERIPPMEIIAALADRWLEVKA